MKRGTPRSAKMSDLVEELECGRAEAIGYVEALFHLTAEEAPAGDIGRLKDKRIEEGMFWSGEPGRLLKALIASKWIDEPDFCRLYTHNWHIHCEDSVRKHLEKNGLNFANGAPPRKYGLGAAAKENGIPKPMPPALPPQIGNLLKAMPTVKSPKATAPAPPLDQSLEISIALTRAGVTTFLGPVNEPTIANIYAAASGNISAIVQWIGKLGDRPKKWHSYGALVNAAKEELA